MDYVFAILLGFIQGLTEFLPVSSSGHLVFLHKILDFNLDDNLGFDVALHLGTLLVLLAYFRKDLTNLFTAWLGSFRRLKKRQMSNDHQGRLAWGIVIGTIPAILVGFFLGSYIRVMFHNLFWVAVALIVVGILFLVVEKKSVHNQDQLDKMTIRKSFWVGCAQALALLPGVSRSGVTIITGMRHGLTRPEAARFSFLLSIPVVLGAGVKAIVDLAGSGRALNQFGVTLVGFFASVIVGYFCIRYFLKFVQKYSLGVFAYYRFVLGFLILFWVFLK